ncbi:MAG: MBL fold metallo-hydrolase [Christensenellales bacterium]
MEFTFCPLFSGSSGNAVYVRAGDTRLLIDAGLSGRTISEGLASIGVLPETLSGILVTHEHSDHIKGVGILSRKYHVPIYANDRTWQAMERSLGNIAPGSRRVFESGETFYIGNAGIMPYRISHDAAEPVGYRVYYGGHSVATATDIGVFTKKTLEALSGTDIVLLESNHDIDMLHANDHYSAQLKTRILGLDGHLSNEACGEALLQLYQQGVRHAVLGHLSHENNTPELAMSTVCGVLRAHGLELSEDIQVDMAWAIMWEACMKSSKGRAALCWILAVLSIPVGIVLTSVLYALIPGENTALRLYLFNIPSEIFCFALPAFFILAARPERLACFRATKRGLSVNTVGYTALLAVSATIVVSMIANGEVLNSSFQYTEPAQPRIVPQNAPSGRWRCCLRPLVPAWWRRCAFAACCRGC